MMTLAAFLSLLIYLVGYAILWHFVTMVLSAIGLSFSSKIMQLIGVLGILILLFWFFTSGMPLVPFLF